MDERRAGEAVAATGRPRVSILLLMRFLTVVACLLVLDVLWWCVVERQLRRHGRAGILRAAVRVFIIFQAVGLVVLAGQRRGIPDILGVVGAAAVYIWHLMVLPAAALCAGGAQVLAWALGAMRKAGWATAEDPPAPRADGGCCQAGDLRPTRRGVLWTAAAIMPPLLAGAGAVAGSAQATRFRVRRMELALPALPAELNGLTIAHIADIHSGRFTQPAKLDDIARVVNDMRADIVAVVGDLVDVQLRHLPPVLEMLGHLRSRYGVFICEGNHDLVDSPAMFRRAVASAGYQLLVNSTQRLNIGGRPVQVMGLRWGMGGAGGAAIAANMAELLPRRAAGAFHILLAHHPHAFDAAAAAGLPLTLSGHTHGGQIMLGNNFGAGPLMFKYWSGVYRNGRSCLVVSNGVGNWMPLRTWAPAEIIHITLRPAPAEA